MKETLILFVCLYAFAGCIAFIYNEIQAPIEKSTPNNSPEKAPKIFYDRPVGLIGKELRLFENEFEKPWKRSPDFKGAFAEGKNVPLNKLARHTLRQPKKEVRSPRQKRSPILT